MTREQAIEKKNELMGKPEAWGLAWRQFNHCQAYTATYNSKWDIIKSYSTIVGIVDKDEQVMYELGKWSRTTSKQMTQIHNQLYRSYDFVRA